MLSTRQSSLGLVVPRGAASLGSGNCMQSWPYWVALRTPRQATTGCGGLQRRSPTGGAAYGIPLKETTPSFADPPKTPVSTVTVTVPLSADANAPTPIPSNAAHKPSAVSLAIRFIHSLSHTRWSGLLRQCEGHVNTTGGSDWITHCLSNRDHRV